MPHFSTEEINLICLYDPGNRAGTIYELRNMTRYLMPDEADLMKLTDAVISKLEAMTDADYDALSDELTPDCFEAFDGEDAAFGSCFLDIMDIDPIAEIE